MKYAEGVQLDALWWSSYDDMMIWWSSYMMTWQSSYDNMVKQKQICNINFNISRLISDTGFYWISDTGFLLDFWYGWWIMQRSVQVDASSMRAHSNITLDSHHIAWSKSQKTNLVEKDSNPQKWLKAEVCWKKCWRRSWEKFKYWSKFSGLLVLIFPCTSVLALYHHQWTRSAPTTGGVSLLSD